jgi:hypothetical protein
LELTDPGFNHTVLSEFPSRPVKGQAERKILDTLVDRLSELGLIHQRGRQRTDSTHVLAAVRVLNRLERAGETIGAARLLAAVDAATDQPVLAQIPAVLTLRRVWAEQYVGEPGQLHWHEIEDMSSLAELIPRGARGGPSPHAGSRNKGIGWQSEKPA